MGLLDSVLSSAMGAIGGQQSGGQGAVLMQALSGLLAGGGSGGMGAMGGGAGGLAALLQQFQQGGLGDVVQSWVGTGANLPISAEQLQSVLGGDTLGRLAEQTGLSQGDLGQQLSQLLPQVVDRLTPNGELPAGGADLGSMVSGLLGGLLKR